MDEDRRFLYALTAGGAVSGLLLWITFWHGRVLVGTIWGLALCAFLWFRYRGPRYWNRLQRHGARREIQQFKATLVVFALLVVVLSLVLVVKGLIE